MKVLNDCYKNSKAINVKGEPLATKPLIIALLFWQDGLIEWLEGRISKGKTSVLNPLDQSLNEISHNYNFRISD